jgi:hypothetical protein
MSKKLIYFLFLLFATLLNHSLFAQKAKDQRVDIRYVSLPSEKLPPDFTTYSVTVYGSNVSISGKSVNSLNSSIKMNSFARVGETKEGEYGHLRIKVNTGLVTCGRLESRSRSETYKDDKGVEKKRNYYWYELAYSGSTSFSILDPEGTILASGSKDYNSSGKSKEYSTPSALSAEADNIRNSLRKSFAGDMVDAIVYSAQSALSSKYDFSFAKDDPQLYTIKKHDQEDRFESCLENTIAVFKEMPANGDPKLYFPKLESCIAFWESHASKSPGSDKNLQEVFLASNANLAYVYYYLDQFDKAETHAKKIFTVDAKNKRVEQFLETMDKTKQRMEMHNIHTLHYNRDLSKALPPNKVKEIEEAKEEMDAQNNSLPGFLVTESDTVKGTFMRSKEDNDFIFGVNGNTKFMVESEGMPKEYEIPYGHIKSFGIGNRIFRRMSFSPCAKGKSEPGMHIMELVYDHEKIKLFKYYPELGTLSSASTEFAYQKAGETDPVSLLDTKFLLLDKGLANYFSTCPDLSSLCSEGKFELNEEDLLKAARVYAEVCE